MSTPTSKLWMAAFLALIIAVGAQPAGAVTIGPPLNADTPITSETYNHTVATSFVYPSTKYGYRAPIDGRVTLVRAKVNVASTSIMRAKVMRLTPSGSPPGSTYLAKTLRQSEEFSLVNGYGEYPMDLAIKEGEYIGFTAFPGATFGGALAESQVDSVVFGQFTEIPPGTSQTFIVFATDLYHPSFNYEIEPRPGSTTPDPGVVADAKAKILEPAGKKTYKRGKLKKLAGTASDASKVEIALVIEVKTKVSGKRRTRCRAYLTDSKKVPKPAACSTKSLRFFVASGSENWTYTLQKGLPVGNYRLYARALSASGSTQNTFAKNENYVRFKVLARRKRA